MADLEDISQSVNELKDTLKEVEEPDPYHEEIEPLLDEIEEASQEAAEDMRALITMAETYEDAIESLEQEYEEKGWSTRRKALVGGATLLTGLGGGYLLRGGDTRTESFTDSEKIALYLEGLDESEGEEWGVLDDIYDETSNEFFPDTKDTSLEKLTVQYEQNGGSEYQVVIYTDGQERTRSNWQPVKDKLAKDIQEALS